MEWIALDDGVRWSWGELLAFSDGEGDGRDRGQQHLDFGMFYYASAFYGVMASHFAALEEIGHTVSRAVRLMLRKVTHLFGFHDSL